MHALSGLNRLSYTRTRTANYAGDSFIRFSGEVPKFAETQMFAWEASNRGTDVSALVRPCMTIP